MKIAKNQQDWLSATEPYDLIYHQNCRSTRKRRLFACACARRVLVFLPEDSLFSLWIENSERYADNVITDKEFAVARRAARCPGPFGNSEVAHHAQRAVAAVMEKSFTSFKMAGEAAQAAVAAHARPNWDQALREESQAQCEVAHDIFGNPFRPVTLDPTWRTSTVVSLAEAIYAERAFDRLPILADALEDAGCTNADILNHCREPGEHVRGCWAVDLLLGKQ